MHAHRTAWNAAVLPWIWVAVIIGAAVALGIACTSIAQGQDSFHGAAASAV